MSRARVQFLVLSLIGFTAIWLLSSCASSSGGGYVVGNSISPVEGSSAAAAVSTEPGKTCEPGQGKCSTACSCSQNSSQKK